MRTIDYSNLPCEEEIIKNICSKEKVLFDFNFFDIPSTMRRNIKACASLGGYAVTVANTPLNREGIIEAQKACKEYNIKIVLGEEICFLG